VADVKFKTADASIAGIEGGGDSPADILRIQTELFDVGRGRNPHVLAEEVFDFLEKGTGAEHPTVVGIIFGG